jgi:hypothetical protein
MSRLALLAVLCLALVPLAAPAQPASAETRIKAAFLFKFGAFIEWPNGAFAAPESPFVIGVIDADAVADELTRVVAERTILGRPVVVHKVKRGTPIAGVHLLFIGGPTARLTEILAATKGRPTVTVSEIEGVDHPGSIINFVLVEDKVRFDVAMPPAEAASLRISSRLLGVARRVVQGAS